MWFSIVLEGKGLGFLVLFFLIFGRERAVFLFVFCFCFFLFFEEREKKKKKGGGGGVDSIALCYEKQNFISCDVRIEGVFCSYILDLEYSETVACV